MFLVRVMCSVLEVSASGYYAWRGRSEGIRSQANQALLGDIRRVHAESRRRYGSPRVHAALQAEGHPKWREIGLQLPEAWDTEERPPLPDSTSQTASMFAR